MKPSELVKKFGFKSLKAFADVTDVSEKTLVNWHREYPQRFKLLLLGAYLERCLDAKTEYLTPLQ